MKILVILVVLMVGARLYFVFRPKPSGGLPANYAPQQKDPVLTVHAATSWPIILGARQYIQSHGRAPTEDELKSHLVERSVQARAPQGGWISPARPGTPFGAWFYFPETNGFRLYLKMGQDPALLYQESLTGRGEWFFEPGNGSDLQKVELKVDP